jgi:transcriptional regulator with XRE-family HTH domain
MKADLGDLGKNIKKARKEKRMTLEELSELTGVTGSMISQIENNWTQPSIKTLQQISRALDVPIGFFFENQENLHAPVLKEKDRQRLQTKNGVTFFLLTPNLSHHRIEAIYNVFEKNSTTGSLFTHIGEECGIVLRGRIEVSWNGKKYVLQKGDSIYLDSSKPHKITNINDGESIAIWINSPPSW